MLAFPLALTNESVGNVDIAMDQLSHSTCARTFAPICSGKRVPPT